MALLSRFEFSAFPFLFFIFFLFWRAAKARRSLTGSAAGEARRLEPYCLRSTSSSVRQHSENLSDATAERKDEIMRRAYAGLRGKLKGSSESKVSAEK